MTENTNYHSFYHNLHLQAVSDEQVIRLGLALMNVYEEQPHQEDSIIPQTRIPLIEFNNTLEFKVDINQKLQA